MNPTSLEQLAEWSNARIVNGSASLRIESVSTDSRTLRPGDLFVAIQGENFNGSQFISDAARRGAAAAIVWNAPVDIRIPQLIVPDTLAALQQIAGRYRKTLSCKVIAVTGSSGKTSTKDLIASVLGRGFRVLKTEGNFNNHIGLPLTILRADSSHQIAVLEIGMNHPGEIAPLAKLAAPDIAVITNIGTAHLEFMGSRESIALEKATLAEAVPADGHVILNENDDFSVEISRRLRAQVVFAAIDKGEINATDVRPTESGSTFLLHSRCESRPARIGIPGRHMVNNALLAVAAGRLFGLSLEECAEGIATASLTRGRLEQKLVRGVRLLDDTYNANPESVIAALRTLSEYPAAQGRRIAILGKMAELGERADEYYRAVGEVAAEVTLDWLVTVGPEAAAIGAHARRSGAIETTEIASNEEAASWLRDFAHAGDVVLVKGSRTAGMEAIISAFEAENSPRHETAGGVAR